MLILNISNGPEVLVQNGTKWYRTNWNTPYDSRLFHTIPNYSEHYQTTPADQSIRPQLPCSSHTHKMADYPTGRRRQIGYLRNGRSWSSSVHHPSRIKSEPFCILCRLWLVCCDRWWFTVMAVSHRLWWLTVIVRSHTALVRSTGSFD